MMRKLALGLLILFAVPTSAWGDAADDAADELECEMLVSRGGECVEYFWTDGGEIKKGPTCQTGYRKDGRYYRVDCQCNRTAYQDFGFGERAKFHWCEARY
jgi:hypothetical protein